MTGCMMNFHINVQAPLPVNSRGGDLVDHAAGITFLNGGAPRPRLMKIDVGIPGRPRL